MIEDHGGALDYDLMTRTRYKLSDLGGPLDWAALLHFVQHLDHSSALYRAANPERLEQCLWMSGDMDAYIMADLVDCVNNLTWNLQCANTPKGKTRPRRPKAYRRPGETQGEGENVIGKDPVPVSRFDEWWESGGPTKARG